jgi:demethylmenaquinone methyltransferase/2-methoxy-6-polyprenyl-1,4-benzoquinol methylase
MINALKLKSGSQGLDIGCGIGSQCVHLAEAVGRNGIVTGLDRDEALLRHAQGVMSHAGLDERVTLKPGDMYDLPFESACFDWVWSVDCAGYPTGDHQRILKEIKRVLKPSGKVFLAAWSSQQLLPGYSLLEAALNAKCSAYEPYLQGNAPENYFMRLPLWLEKMSFQDVRVRTFVEEIQSPLLMAQRKALISLFGMLWDLSSPNLPDEDKTLFQKIGNPDSPDFLPDQEAYYGFFTYTLFSGRLGS